MPLSKLTLLGVGGLEALIGVYTVLFPTAALPGAVGRLLSVGAESAAPALRPMVAQVGALRLTLGIFILGYATGPTFGEATHRLEACVVAYACLLQPFVAVFRSHPRMPIGQALAFSLLEGGAIVAGLAADADFSMDILAERPEFLAAAAFFASGLLLAFAACTGAVCSKGQSADEEVEAANLKGSGAMPLFDENRHRLSPTSKRLLA